MSRVVAATSAAALALAAATVLPAHAAGAGSDDSHRVTPTPAFTSGLRVSVPGSRPADVALDFLAQRRGTYGIARPHADLHPVGTTTDAGQTAVRLAQTYHGIPVLGAQYIVRMRDRGDHAVVTGSSGHYFAGLAVPTLTTVTRSGAVLVVRRDLRTSVDSMEVHDRGPVVLPFGAGVLTRHLTVTGRSVLTGLPVRKEVYVAAGRSRPVLSYDSIDLDGPVDAAGTGFHGALDLNAYQSGATYLLRDVTRGNGIDTYDAGGADVMRFFTGRPKGRVVSSTTTSFPAASNEYGALDAHWGAAKVYDFYQSLGRAGLDGEGGPIRSYVGVTAGGDDFPNAFWDGREMVYGTGGYGYKPFAASLDVVGHEMTHGVVQYTAGLLGFGQSGALNEAVADYFGNSIENATLGIGTHSPLDGLMGQDLCVHLARDKCSDRNLDAVRTTRQFFGDPMDGGGVHANSTIVSGAFWQLRRIFLPAALTDSPSEEAAEAVADHRADEVMYRALTAYLTPLSDFLDARTAVVAAATDLAASPEELAGIRQSFDERGVTTGWEQRDLHLDSTVLYGGMSLGDGLSVARDHWAIADMGQLGDQLPGVYVGDLQGDHHRRLSPAADLVYDQPATDGRSVAWSAVDPATGRTRIQVRSLTGGHVRTLAAYRNALIWSMSHDGASTAWDVATRRGESVVVQRPNGRRHVVAVNRSHYVGKVAVLGHQVVWSENPTSRREPARVLSYDSRSGRTRVLASVRSEGRAPAAIFGPVLTARHLFYGADHGARSMRAALVRADRSGRHRHTVLASSSRHAPLAPELTASDTAVTFSTMQSWHLYQVAASGGSVHRVSCAKGPQQMPAAGSGRRVVWTELSTGDDDLVTRPGPVGAC
jgi:bacillolysin